MTEKMKKFWKKIPKDYPFLPFSLTVEILNKKWKNEENEKDYEKIIRSNVHENMMALIEKYMPEHFIREDYTYEDMCDDVLNAAILCATMRISGMTDEEKKGFWTNMPEELIDILCKN